MHFLNWFGIFLGILYLDSNGLVEGSKALRQIQPIVSLHCQSDFKGTTLIVDAATVLEGSCYDVSNIFPGCDVGSIDIHPGYCASLYRTNCLDTVTANVSSLTPWLNDIHKSFLGNLGALIFFQCDIAELGSCKAQLTECINEGINTTLSNVELFRQIEFAEKQATNVQNLLNICKAELTFSQSQVDSDLERCLIQIGQLESVQQLCKVELVLVKIQNEDVQVVLDDLRNQVTLSDIQLRTCHEEAVAAKNEIANLQNNSLGVSYKLEKCQNETRQCRQEMPGLQRQVHITQRNIDICHERAANAESNLTITQNEVSLLKIQFADAESKAAVAEIDSFASKNLTIQTQSQVDNLQIKLLHVESQLTKCTNEVININQIATRYATEMENAVATREICLHEARICKSKVSILEKKIEAANANYNKLRLIACNQEKILVVACERKTADLKCSTGKMINIVTATYGRSNSLTCGFQKNIKCNSTNSLLIVFARCNGKNSCQVQASNSVFGDPCRGTVKYLEISYTCQQLELRTICA